MSQSPKRKYNKKNNKNKITPNSNAKTESKLKGLKKQTKNYKEIS